MKKLSRAARDGVKAADWLLERAPRALFEEYRRRPGSLRVRADGAVADVVADAEERAWYCGWNTAMALCAGRRGQGQNGDNG